MPLELRTEQMTDLDREILFSVTRRAFKKAMGIRLLKELMLVSEHRLSVRATYNIVQNCLRHLYLSSAYQHNREAMLMFSRRLLITPMADAHIALKGHPNKEIMKILVLCEEICLKSDFPSYSAAKDIDLHPKYKAKVTF